MQAQGPGTATAGVSRFVGQLKAENVNGPLSALFSMATRNPESYFTVKSLYTFLATSTNVNVCKPKTSQEIFNSKKGLSNSLTNWKRFTIIWHINIFLSG